MRQWSVAAHREEQVEPAAPQVDVDLVRHHGAGHLGVGDEEHVLVGRAGERDAGQLAHRAVRAVAAGDPRDASIFRDVPSASFSVAATPPASCVRRDELGVPLHRHAEVAEPIAHDALVVVLAEDEDVRIRRDVLPGVAQRDVRGLSPLRPHIRAGAALAELERTIDDAEAGVDLQRARLHAERPRLQRGSGVPVDDRRAHAAPRELIGEHEPRRAGSDDQNVRLHRASSVNLFGRPSPVNAKPGPRDYSDAHVSYRRDSPERA